MVAATPDAWTSGAVTHHSNQVSADTGLCCRETEFFGQRQTRQNVPRATDRRSHRPHGRTKTPPIAGLCNRLREFFANGELCGSMERCPMHCFTIHRPPLMRLRRTGAIPRLSTAYNFFDPTG